MKSSNPHLGLVKGAKAFWKEPYLKKPQNKTPDLYSKNQHNKEKNIAWPTDKDTSRDPQPFLTMKNSPNSQEPKN